MEELAQTCARDFNEFYEYQQTQSQQLEQTGEIIVISADGKGVIMRREDLRPSTQKRAIASQRKLEKRLTKGEKRNSKRMATVAAVYTIKPFIRTAEQIINPKEFPPVKRPRPEGKRVWASLVKEPETVISEAFDEALHRDPNQQKHWVALVDGNKTQLRLLKQLSRQHNIKLTIVLDIIHVIEYLWKAAFVFHSPTDKQAEDWVSQRLLCILKGQSSLVAAGMRRSEKLRAGVPPVEQTFQDSATLRQLKIEQRSPVDKCANYLLNHAGFPIATGVIEGACRYLIKDRMDITGARWSLEGAESVLRLRSLYVSGDWHEYWRFHQQMELQRHHLSVYQGGIPLLKGVSHARCSITPPPISMVV